jgi:membrane peptidoglycan carboxypeptidase
VPAEGRRVVSPTTAAAMREMLAQAVASGTGQAAAIDGYHAAGKTGTARKPQPGGGYRDAHGNYHYVASFAGFIPADDPQVSVIIVIDEPTTSAYASDVAAPAFASIGRQALRTMRIAPPTAAGAVGTLPPLEEPKVRAQPALPPTTTTTTTTPTTNAQAATTVPGAIPATAPPVSPTPPGGQPGTTTTTTSTPAPARGG